jgi:phage/plasmid-like protein (TIGR03299 family)
MNVDNTLVSTREVPWMKLGKLVDKPLTAAEAAQAGGLNFTVEKRPLAFGTVDGSFGSAVINPFPGRVAIVRNDTLEPLGIMSKDYPLLQYGEAFDFMDTISPEYVACGALKGGRQGFLVVKAPETITVLNGDDPHEMYAVLRTSHDGTRAVEIMVMPLRQRCMNQLTLTSFSKGVDHRWAIRHTSSMHLKLAEAQDSMKKIGIYAKRYEEVAQRLISCKIDNKQATGILEAVLPDRPKREEQITTIIGRWHDSPTVGKDLDYTGWGLLQGVSDYFEWGRKGGSAESRFVGALQGSTHKVINRTAARLLSRV